MPSNTNSSSSTRRTTDLKMPTKKDGSIDKRYSNPQFCKSNGTRDLRTKTTSKRK